MGVGEILRPLDLASPVSRKIPAQTSLRGILADQGILDSYFSFVNDYICM